MDFNRVAENATAFAVRVKIRREIPVVLQSQPLDT